MQNWGKVFHKTWKNVFAGQMAASCLLQSFFFIIQSETYINL